MRTLMGAALLGGALCLGAAGFYWSAPSAQAQQAAALTRVAIHVDENDPARMNMALNNAANIRSYYAEQGKEVEVKIVAYGPGLNMLRADTSPVAQRIAAMSLEDPHLSFAACANTLAGMTKKEGKEIALVDEAELVPSGAVELIELQRQGWAYLRP